MLVVDGVRKRHGRGRAVLAGVDLLIEPGRPVVVRGANGSGKSTLLRIVAGCERPTAGRVRGRPVVVGFVPDRVPAAGRLSASGYLRSLAAVHRAPAGDALAFLDRLAFTGDVAAPLARLSKGNAQKVALAQALACRAGLVVLDEPWSGLDAIAADTLTAEIAAVAAGGALVLVAGHREVAARLPDADHVELRDGTLHPADGGHGGDGDRDVDGDGHGHGHGHGDPIDGGNGSGSGAVVTIELDVDGDPAAAIAALPAVTRWRAIDGGIEACLPAEHGDAWLAAALRHGGSVRSVRRARA